MDSSNNSEKEKHSADPIGATSPIMNLNLSKCRPIVNYSEIEECLSNPPEWINRVLPLVKRSEFVIKNQLSDCHTVDSDFTVRPRLDSRMVPKTLICHDYQGGYHQDAYIPFEGEEDRTLHSDGYTFYNWSQIDYFVYFSHYFITIPPLAWINAGHKNGVKVLGTVITESSAGVELCNEKLFKTSDQMKEFVYQLVDIQRTFGFDGWLLNIENPIQNVAVLKEFVKLLTRESRKQYSDSVIIWYDSVTKDGQLKWQDELNELNECFFDNCDGIFLNYGWNEAKLQNSKIAAGPRQFDVFVGVDVFGRNMFGGGQFNTYKAAELISKYKLSMALFAPGWTHETMEKVSSETNFNRFMNRDDALWTSLSPFLYTHPINVFFETDFHLGLDHNNYNLYMQQVQISILLYPQYLKMVPNYLSLETLINKCACLKRGFFRLKNACVISNAHLEEARKYVHRMFSCDIQLSGKIGVYYLINKSGTFDTSWMNVVLCTYFRSGSLRKVTLLGKPKSGTIDNVSALEVNPVREEEVKYSNTLNEIARKYTRYVGNTSDAKEVQLRMFEFYTTTCDLLEIGASVQNGTTVQLLEFGVVQLD